MFHLFLLMTALYSSAKAGPPSYRLAHPLGWMHDLPVGEMPGWSSTFWTNLEVSTSNVWNNQFDMTNTATGKTMTYVADFEQGSFILDLGAAITENIAIGVEVPFASRGGGIMDDFIDQFHQFIGSERFLRNENNKFSRKFITEADGVDTLGKNKPSGLGNIKTKLKYWVWKWMGDKSGSCDCGFSVSGQAKFSVGNSANGFSSGHNDYSLLLHLGAPIGQYSGIWATAAFTALGANDVLVDWPARRTAQMYELSMDLAFDANWGLILQARTESPIMNKGGLQYNYTASDPNGQVVERVASGWNSLVYWRGSQSAGIRLRSGTGHQISVLIIEDWNFGSHDSRKDFLYVNNAPDVAFVSQLHFKF